MVNGQGKSVTTTFDNVGRKLTIAQSNGANASQVFDAVGNVRSIANTGPGSASSVMTYSYDYSNHAPPRPAATARPPPGPLTPRCN